jgi:hypothetical protein
MTETQNCPTRHSRIPHTEFQRTLREAHAERPFMAQPTLRLIMDRLET